MFYLSKETDARESDDFIYQRKPMLEKGIVFTYQKIPMLENGVVLFHQTKLHNTEQYMDGLDCIDWLD